MMPITFSAVFWTELEALGIVDISICSYCQIKPKTKQSKLSEIQQVGIDSYFVDVPTDTPEEAKTNDIKSEIDSDINDLSAKFESKANEQNIPITNTSPCKHCQGTGHSSEGHFIYDEFSAMQPVLPPTSILQTKQALVLKELLQSDYRPKAQKSIHPTVKEPGYLFYTDQEDLCSANRRGREFRPFKPNFSKALTKSVKKYIEMKNKQLIGADKLPIRTKQFIVESFTDLILENLEISEIDPSISKFNQIESLTLSSNKINTITCLPSQLKSLNLKANSLKIIQILPSIPPLQHLNVSKNKFIDISSLLVFKDTLVSLDISCNCISDLEHLLASLKQLSQLKSLTLFGNPCCLLRCYRAAIMHYVSTLTTLDGISCVPTEEELSFKQAKIKENELKNIPLSPKESKKSQKQPPAKKAEPKNTRGSVIDPAIEEAKAAEAARIQRCQLEWSYVPCDNDLKSDVLLIIQVESLTALPKPNNGGFKVEPVPVSSTTPKSKKPVKETSKNSKKEDPNVLPPVVTEEVSESVNELGQTVTTKTTTTIAITYFLRYRLENEEIFETNAKDWSDAILFQHHNRQSFCTSISWNTLFSEHGIDFLLYQRTKTTVSIQTSTPTVVVPPTPSKPSKDKKPTKT